MEGGEGRCRSMRLDDEHTFGKIVSYITNAAGELFLTYDSDSEPIDEGSGFGSKKKLPVVQLSDGEPDLELDVPQNDGETGLPSPRQ
jgi:hypothetical protein